MSIFTKVLTSIGIGSARVDTKLEHTSYKAGDPIRGVVEVYGGVTEQTIDAIYLTVNTTFTRQKDDHPYTETAAIEQYQITEPFLMKANETKVFPFSFTLPIDAPLTFGNTRVWVQTGLDIKNAVNPQDEDYIAVRPNQMTAAVIEKIEKLGFRLRKVECEQTTFGTSRSCPFIQEFEFFPVNGLFLGKLDKLKIAFLEQTEERMELFMEVDRHARGLGGFLSEILETDKNHMRFSIASQDSPLLSKLLEQKIICCLSHRRDKQDKKN
ncbi:MAG: sporulation protein [Bacillales bacterium]|nr:sporulation protein [Bacillales bacterium]